MSLQRSVVNVNHELPVHASLLVSVNRSNTTCLEKCYCDSFNILRPLKRSRLEEDKANDSFRCQAHISMGIGLLCCVEPAKNLQCSSEINICHILCLKHQKGFTNHRACAHCGYFVKAGAVLRCSYNLGHVTHLRCARRFSTQKGSFECSHCETEGTPDIISAQPLNFPAIINKSKSILAVADISEDILDDWEPTFLNGSCTSLSEQCIKLTEIETSNFDFLSLNLASSFAKTCFAKHRLYGDFREMLLLLVTNRLYNIAEEMCKFVLEGQISNTDFWGDGEILSLAIRAEQTNLVRTLRDVGCSVMPSHLCLLTFHYSSGLFDALSLDSEYSYVMLALNKNDGNSALHYAASSGHWTYVQRLLEHFQYKGLCPDMPNSDGKTLLELCSCAPEDIQNAIRHTIRITEFSKYFPKKNIVLEDLSNGSERFPVRVVNDVDDSAIDKFVYTTRVVDRTGILAARNNDMVVYCLCIGDCLLECQCSSGVYDNKGHIRGPSLDWAFLECSSACVCSMRCGNRVAQKGATYAVEIYRTCDNRGWAVRALRSIPCGAFIGEYTGELLNEFEANERSDSYLFETAVGENNYTIDARLYGNFTRFINHSCEPNAKVGLVVWDSQVEQLSHICIFATRNISKGEEITISYGENWWGTKIFEFSCLCKRLSCQFTEDRRCAILNKKEQEIRDGQESSDNIDQHNQRA